jgi:hypothetical protein
MTAWIGYLFNGGDPAKKALLDGHRACTWDYAQTMHSIVGSDTIEDGAFDRLRQENDRVNELQHRIHARCLVLKHAGASPAFAEQITAWNTT